MIKVRKTLLPISKRVFLTCENIIVIETAGLHLLLIKIPCVEKTLFRFYQVNAITCQLFEIFHSTLLKKSNLHDGNILFRFCPKVPASVSVLY